MPNGVVIEAPIKHLDHECAICTDLAIRLEIPRYESIEEFVTDQWCFRHTLWIVEKSKEAHQYRVQLREEMLKGFRPWRPLTWWQAKLFIRKMLGG